MLLQKDVEPLATNGLSDEAEHVGAEVRVDEAGAWLALERCLDDCLARFARRHGDAPQIASRGQTRAMLEQLLDRNVVLESAAERRDELRDFVVEANLALIVQHHDRRGRGDDFGERCEIVDRVRWLDRRLAAPTQIAEALF